VKLIKGGARPASKLGSLVLMQITLFLQDFEVCNEDSKGCLSREDSTVGLVMSFLVETLKGIYFFILLNFMSTRKIAQLYHNEINRGFLPFEDFKKAFNSVFPKLSEKIIFERCDVPHSTVSDGDREIQHKKAFQV
uniref:Uncharacterized protein n=1 Tax=Serinus canaria TaxID=9135 RepID=A0A8C9N0A8_SERCA